MVAKVTRVCRVCGKEYETCPYAKDLNNPYRWQDVACSPECGAKFFYDVLIARGQLEEAKQFEPRTPEEESPPCSNSSEVETAGVPLKGRKKRPGK